MLLWGKNLVGCVSSTSIFHWSRAWLLLPLLATVKIGMVKRPGEKKPLGLQSSHYWLLRESLVVLANADQCLLCGSTGGHSELPVDMEFMLGQQKEEISSGCWDSTTGFLEGRGLEIFLEQREQDGWPQGQRFQSLVSTGHCKWFHTNWHMERVLLGLHWAPGLAGCPLIHSNTCPH